MRRISSLPCRAGCLSRIGRMRPCSAAGSTPAPPPFGESARPSPTFARRRLLIPSSRPPGTSSPATDPEVTTMFDPVSDDFEALAEDKLLKFTLDAARRKLLLNQHF